MSIQVCMCVVVSHLPILDASLRLSVSSTLGAPDGITQEFFYIQYEKVRLRLSSPNIKSNVVKCGMLLVAFNCCYA